MRYFQVLTLVLLLIHSAIFSQVTEVLVSEPQIDNDLLIRVKQLNEFAERFNYEKDFLNRKPSDDFKREISRKNYIKLLFNQLDDRFADTVSAAQKEYHALIDRFTDEVVYNNYKFDMGEALYADAETKVKYKLGLKERDLNLILKKVRYEDLTSAWLLAAVDFDEFRPGQGHEFETLSPSENETNFIGLSKIFDNNKLPAATASFHYDQMTLFYYFMAQGDLKLKYVDEIEYHYLGIPGWIFSVKEYIREGYNTGWLISNLLQADQEQKLAYLKEKLFIANPEIPNTTRNNDEEKLAYSLQDKCPSVVDHGILNSTAAWSLGYYCMGIINNVKTGNTTPVNNAEINFSPYYLQNGIADRYQGDGCDMEIDLNEALFFIKNHGIVKFDDYPIQCNIPFDSGYVGLAKLNRIKDYNPINPPFAEVKDVAAQVRLRLKKSIPVPVTMNVDSDFDQLTKPLWIPGAGNPDRTIAIVLIGFDDNKYGGAFEAVHSNGQEWGQNGFCWIRYQDFNNVVKEAYEIQY